MEEITLTSEHEGKLKQILGSIADEAFHRDFEQCLSNCRWIQSFEQGRLSREQLQGMAQLARNGKKLAGELADWWHECDVFFKNNVFRYEARNPDKHTVYADDEKAFTFRCGDKRLIEKLPYVLSMLDQCLDAFLTERLSKRGGPKTPDSTSLLVSEIGLILKQRGVDLTTYHEGKFGQVVCLAFRVCGIPCISDVGNYLNPAVKAIEATK